ncbi:MAG: MFS transporter [bacterium]|nr:MFS transporter [bacterium]
MSDENQKRRIPLNQAILYASGYFGVQMIAFSIGQIPQIYYVPVEGVSLIAPITIFGAVIAGGYLFGLLNGLGRIVDGFDDPWIGNISDHFRSRFGRRKPFLVIGAPLMGLFLVLFTMPPTHDPSIMNLIWLAFIYPLFFIFFTTAVTPYLAMLPEITPTPSDRLLVTTLQSVFLILGTFGGVAVIQFIPDTIPFTPGAIIIASIATIPFLLVAAFVKIPNESTVEENITRPSTFSQVKSALSFTPFRIYLIATICFWFGFKMVETSAKYIAAYLFGDNGAFILILGTALAVATVAGVGSYWLGKKFGKRKSMIVMSIMFAVLLPFIGLIGIGPFKNPAMGYILFALIGLPLSLLFIIPNSLLADIIDRDSEQSGKHREGLYFASQALLNKVGIALSATALNIILKIGATSSAEGTHAVGETGVRIIGPVASIFILIGLAVFLKFPDIEKR